MKATRLLAAIFGGGSLLILAQMGHAAWSEKHHPLIRDDETSTLSYLIVDAEARHPSDAYLRRLAKYSNVNARQDRAGMAASRIKGP